MTQAISPRSVPTDLAAEIGMVGSIIRNPAILESVRFFASPAMLTDANATAVFSAACNLADAHRPVDHLTIIGELIRLQSHTQEEAVQVVQGMRAAVPTTAHAEYYAMLVREKSILRSVISLCHTTQNQAFDGEKAEAVIDGLQNGAAKIAEAGFIEAGKLAADCLPAVLDDIHGYKDDDSLGMTTGFPELDQRTRGMKKKQLITICGAGKIGKTSFAINIVGHVGLARKEAVAVISHEMTKEELTERLLVSEAGIPLDRLQANNLDAEELAAYELVQEKIRNSRIIFDDSCPTTIHGTRIRLRLFKRLYKIKLGVIDYFQLMTGSDPKVRRYDQLVEVSRGLKQLACDLDIPLVVLAQLGADGQDADRPPRVTDIEECKRIFKDSNWVVLLDREYERKKHNADWVRNNGDQRNAGTIDVAAIRNGEAGVIGAFYHGAIQRWRTASQEADLRLSTAYAQGNLVA